MHRQPHFDICLYRLDVPLYRLIAPFYRLIVPLCRLIVPLCRLITPLYRWRIGSEDKPQKNPRIPRKNLRISPKKLAEIFGKQENILYLYTVNELIVIPLNLNEQ